MADESQYESGVGDEGDAQDPKKAALGARLRAARMHVAMTQEDLAARVQRKKNWLSDIERGRRGIDPHTLQEIAQITGRPVEYFTNPGYDDQRKRQLNRPATREDWELLYAGDPERAAAHASLDDAFDRARVLLDPSDDVVGAFDRARVLLDPSDDVRVLLDALQREVGILQDGRGAQGGHEEVLGVVATEVAPPH